MSYNGKNYRTQDGGEWVVGGKLTFLPGAVVEGIEDLFDAASGEEVGLSYMANSEATTVAALREDFNTLLDALRKAGLMAAEHVAETTAEAEPENEAEPFVEPQKPGDVP